MPKRIDGLMIIYFPKKSKYFNLYARNSLLFSFIKIILIKGEKYRIEDKILKRNHEILLTVDGIVNLGIGILLLLIPFGLAEIIGVPRSNLDFYPMLLGSVIFGIGVALLIERYGYSRTVL